MNRRNDIGGVGFRLAGRPRQDRRWWGGLKGRSVLLALEGLDGPPLDLSLEGARPSLVPAVASGPQPVAVEFVDAEVAAAVLRTAADAGEVDRLRTCRGVENDAVLR